MLPDPTSPSPRELADAGHTGAANDTARAAADSASAVAETVHALAETARDAAETARDTAEDAREKAAADAARAAADSARAVAETVRALAETARAAAETARDKAAADVARAAADSATAVAETVHALAEAARAAADAARDKADAARAVAETAVALADATRARAMAEAASRAKSEFLSRVSHELRTPLTAIIGFSELGTLTDDPALQRDYNAKVGQAADHLLALIDDILDISRIDGGDVSLSMETVSIGKVIQHVGQMTTHLAQTWRVALDLATPTGIHVHGDRGRLRQVIINLVSNAIKYNHPGGSVRVTVSQVSNDVVRVDVIDSGVGLSPEQIGNLFTPFDRLGAEALGIAGTGLGLTISKRLTEAMGGRIEVSSREGEGSVFSVELKAAEQPVPETEIVGSQEVPRTYATNRRVLYIEDVTANVEVVEGMLERRPSVRLMSALLGRAGLEMAREEKPHLILLDLHLPDMPGEEVLSLLHADPLTSRIPVVVISADAMHASANRLLALGAADYITKPMRLERVLSVLDSLLDPSVAKE